MKAFLSYYSLVSVVLWGQSFIATRIALTSLSPVAVVALRHGTGAAVLAGWLLARRRPLLPAPGDRLVSVGLGVILGVHLLVQTSGLLYTSAINTAWIIAFIPVTIAVGARIFLGQRLPLLGWVGVVVGLAGVLGVTASPHADFARAHWGDLLQLISCFTWTAYTLLSAGPVSRNGALSVTGVAMAVAAMINAAAVPFIGATVGPLTPEVMLAVVFLGVLCSGVAYACWNLALDKDGATRTGAMIYFEPFVTLATAVAVLSEPVTINALLGGPVVLLGVWLMGRRSDSDAPTRGAGALRDEQRRAQVAP